METVEYEAYKEGEFPEVMIDFILCDDYVRVQKFKMINNDLKVK